MTLPTRLIGLKFLAFTAPSFFRMSAIEVAFKNLSNEPLSWKYRKNFVVSSFTTLQHHWNKAIKNSLGPRALSPFIPCKACYVSSSSNSHSSCSTSTALASIELNCWDYVFCLRNLMAKQDMSELGFGKESNMEASGQKVNERIDKQS
uniref:Uncharacterized protein n=1 Tax=Quercus lobata TaxID=97700 RepID=A0A7N2LLV5_QUELO